MENTKNKQIITISVTALVTFLATSFLFSYSNFRLFGTATNTTSGNHISGLILQDDGSASGRALVEAYGADESVVIGVAKRDGSYALEGLTSGSFVVVGSVLRGNYGYIGTLNLASGDNTTTLDITLSPTGTITGTVDGCDESCVANLKYNGTSIRAESILSDGSFVIDGVAPGTYTLQVFSGNSSTTVETIVVESGGEINLALALA